VPSPGARYRELAAIEAAAEAAISDMRYQKAARRRPPHVGLRILPEG
jgi:hypothetical protein